VTLALGEEKETTIQPPHSCVFLNFNSDLSHTHIDPSLISIS